MAPSGLRRASPSASSTDLTTRGIRAELRRRSKPRFLSDLLTDGARSPFLRPRDNTLIVYPRVNEDFVANLGQTNPLKVRPRRSCCASYLPRRASVFARAVPLLRRVRQEVPQHLRRRLQLRGRLEQGVRLRECQGVRSSAGPHSRSHFPRRAPPRSPTRASTRRPSSGTASRAAPTRPAPRAGSSCDMGAG